MRGVLTSRFHNPEPSYSWEPLDLDEIKRLTDIQLNHKGWKIYFTNFHLLQTQNHTNECKAKSLHAGYFGCNCILGNALVAIWKAGSQEIDGVGRGRELFVNVPYDNVNDKEILVSIEKRPKQVQDLIFMGFEQLITLLKVYEVTRLVLEFGPPMRLYTEERFKVRKYVREIDGDILWNILHDIKEEKKECLEEKKVLALIEK